jgi:hypothetical protein
MIVMVKTVETIVKQYAVDLPDGTTEEDVFSKVEETEEGRAGWTESDFTAIESLTEIASADGNILWASQQ